MDFKVRPKNKFTKMKNITKTAEKQDLGNGPSDINNAPEPIRKLYQVAMESRDEVLEQMCVEQYIEEAM